MKSEAIVVFFLCVCLPAPPSTWLMQRGRGFVAPGADTAAQRRGGATGGRNGLELYHCELMPLFTEEWERQKEEKEQKAV